MNKSELIDHIATQADISKAAAGRALAERDRVRAALSRHGVTVVDAPADRLAPAVADTYLRLKSLGQL